MLVGPFTQIPGTPQASATVGFFRLGDAPVGGSASGNYFTINAPSGYAGNVALFQVNGTVVNRFTKDGYLGIGTTDPGTTSGIRALLSTTTITSGIFIENVYTGAATTIRAGRFAVYNGVTSGDAAALGYTGTVFYRGTSATTQTAHSGGACAVGIDSTSPTGTVTDANCFRANQIANSAGGTPVVTFTRGNGLHVDNLCASLGSGLTVTNSHAIYILAQSGAATKSWSIMSLGGESQLKTGANTTKALTLVANSGSQTAAIFEIQDSGGIARLYSSSMAAVADNTLNLRAITSQTGHLLQAFAVDGTTSVCAITVAGVVTAPTVTLRATTTTNVVIGTTSASATKGVVLSSLSGWQGTSGNQLNTEISSNFNPTSGTAAWQAFKITQTLNQTGGANGAMTGILYDATETAINGTHTCLDLRVGAASKFAVGNTGTTTWADGANFVFGTTTGTKLGTSTTQKIGAYNVTPVVQPSAFTQTYSTATKTHSNPTATTLTDNTGGTANTTLEAIGVVYSQTEVRNNFADLAASNNALIVDVANIKQVVNSVIDDLQSIGWLA